jgi:glycerate 2-kinase
MTSVRLVVAPDKFAGTLSAPEAATAIAEGWLRTWPDHETDLAPMSDGGPGFVDALAAAGIGTLHAAEVSGPRGERVPAAVLLDGETAYVESAQAAGLHLVPAEQRDPTTTTTVGVGELIALAVDAGARKVVVGLGGSATNDGGAGLLAALGATPGDALRHGGGALAGLGHVDLAPARERMAGIEVVAATDVDSPLLGPRGATRGFGPQKGASDEQLDRLEEALTGWAAATDPALARRPGAGAAGGMGFALVLLGASRLPGVRVVLEAAHLAERAKAADLVLTGEGAFDWQSLRGKVVTGVTQVGQETGRPVVVLAGRVEIGRRELAALGVSSAYGVVDHVEGDPMADPAGTLAALAQRVARTWGRPARP